MRCKAHADNRNRSNWPNDHARRSRSGYPAAYLRTPPWQVQEIHLSVDIDSMEHATIKSLPKGSFELLQHYSSDNGENLVLQGKKFPIGYELLIKAVSQHAVICVTDPQGTILYVNEKLCSISCYRAEELLGENYRLFLSDEVIGVYQDQLWSTLSNGQIWQGELKQVAHHGRGFWVDVTATPFAGEPGLYVFVQTEISSFKQAEIALQTSDKKHRALLEQANDAILLIDMDGWLITANRRAERLTGYPRDELMNMHMQQLVPESMRSELLDLHQDVLEKKCDSIHGGVVLRKDGKALPVDVSCAVVEFGGQRVVQSILRDNTHRKMMETDLIKAKIMAERANRAKTEFISRISHELRTPLNAILGFAQLMQTDETPPLAGSHREGINQILNAGWHLLELIEDVLNFSQIETGSLRVEEGSVSAGEVLQECKELLEPLAKERNITLDLLSNSENIMLLADKVRLKEILLNLGSNAIKYNKINGCVSFSALVESGKVRINISDTGIGIRPEKMQQLFEPFDRLGQEDSAIHGSGLGLVIAKRLAELMGGNLGVWSEPGVGSTFWVDLKVMEKGGVG